MVLIMRVTSYILPNLYHYLLLTTYVVPIYINHNLLLSTYVVLFDISHNLPFPVGRVQHIDLSFRVMDHYFDNCDSTNSVWLHLLAFYELATNILNDKINIPGVPRRKNLGVGTKLLLITIFYHHYDLIQEKYINGYQKLWIHNCSVVGKLKNMVIHRGINPITVVVLWNKDSPDTEFCMNTMNAFVFRYGDPS